MFYKGKANPSKGLIFGVLVFLLILAVFVYRLRYTLRRGAFLTSSNKVHPSKSFVRKSNVLFFPSDSHGVRLETEKGKTPFSKDGFWELDLARLKRDRSYAVSKAVEWRHGIRTEEVVKKKAFDLFLAKTTPQETRIFLALIFGSFSEIEFQTLLLEAVGKNPSQEVLRWYLVALGEMPFAERDDVFDMQGLPYAVESPVGIAVKVQRLFTSPEVLHQLRQIYSTVNEETIKETILTITQFSLLQEESRILFEQALDETSSEEIVAQAGKGLLSFLTSSEKEGEANQNPLPENEKRGITLRVLTKALYGGNLTLCFRIENELKELLEDAELHTLVLWLRHQQSFESLYWGLSILKDSVSRMNSETQSLFHEDLKHYYRHSSEPKIQMLTKEALTHFPTDDANLKADY